MDHGIYSKRSQGLIDFACEFAAQAHGEQKRKYTNEPYVNHPINVARIVSEITDDCEIISAAFLHDVIEDTWVTYEDLINAGFGFGIADLVLAVTDVSKPEDGNRVIRKKIDRQYLAGAHPRAKTIKLADLIDNTRSICMYDKDFAKIYMGEKKQLLEVLTEGNAILHSKATNIVEDYYKTNRDNA